MGGGCFEVVEEVASSEKYGKFNGGATAIGRDLRVSEVELLARVGNSS